MKKKWIQQELFPLSYREVAYKALAAWVAREMDREVGEDCTNLRTTYNVYMYWICQDPG